jgi:hypothetical protein
MSAIGTSRPIDLVRLFSASDQNADIAQDFVELSYDSIAL